MPRHVLVLSDEGSAIVEKVCAAVRKASGMPVVVRPGSLPSSGTIVVGQDTVLISDGETPGVDVACCTGIWSWHPQPIRAPDRDEQHRKYIEQEWRLAVAGMHAMTDSRVWINDLQRSAALDGHKLRQYALAASAGLQVPPTILTNDPATIREAAETWGVVAIKPQGGVALRMEDGSWATTFTQRCTGAELVGQDDALRRAPLLVQPYLEKAWEVRVTVIDDEVIACRIDSQSHPRTHIDWRRYADPHVSHELITLAPELEASVRLLMKRAGLRYAAIDLLVTPAGETWFLDLNPSGQFGWIEDLTGAPISRHLADALLTLPGSI